MQQPTPPPQQLTLVAWDLWSDVSYEQDGLVEALQTPVTTIVISLENQFLTCRTEEGCRQRMQQLQHFYIDNYRCPNVPYNFMIGNDGCIYEGRGWHEKPFRARKHEMFRHRTIDIAVVGSEKEALHEGLDVVERFVKECVQLRMIALDHIVKSFQGDKTLF